MFFIHLAAQISLEFPSMVMTISRDKLEQCKDNYQDHTKSKFLLKPNSDKNKTQHVGKHMDDPTVQPHAREETPNLVSMNHFINFHSTHLL